jgi:hypothetical protein
MISRKRKLQMNMPGFTAEASLGKATGLYGTSPTSGAASAQSSVTPQLDDLGAWLAWITYYHNRQIQQNLRTVALAKAVLDAFASNSTRSRGILI